MNRSQAGALVGGSRGEGDTHVCHLQAGGLALPATKKQSTRSREDFGRFVVSRRIGRPREDYCVAGGELPMCCLIPSLGPYFKEFLLFEPAKTAPLSTTRPIPLLRPESRRVEKNSTVDYLFTAYPFR